MKTENAATRRVLAGVPQVGFYGTVKIAGRNLCPEDMPLAGCLRAALEYLGDEDLGCRERGLSGAITTCGNNYLLTVSGEAFMLKWNTERWDWGNGSVLSMTDEPLTAVTWALEGVGYAGEALGNRDKAAEGLFPVYGDEATFRQRIMASIDAGRPVLGFGVVGPPECCLITGYDEGGDLLIGWSYFQGMPDPPQGLAFEPEGTFRKRDWFPETAGIVVLGEKLGRPDLAEVCRKTLERGLTVLRTPRVHGVYASGLAAWDAWIAALLDEEAFRRADDAALHDMFGVHNADAVGGIAERRCYGGITLADWVGVYPAAADALGQAGGCFAVEHDLMWRVWECLGGHPAFVALPEDPALRFARRDSRERIVAALGEAKARDVEAAEHIEEALAIIAREGRGGEMRVAPRAVLADVPYIGFDTARTGGVPRTTEMCAAMHSALTYLGEPHSYPFLMGASGAAFRLAWNAERWEGGNISTLTMGEDPTEPFRRMFGAVGWVPKFLGNPQWRPGQLPQPPASPYQGPDYLGSNLEFVDEAAFREQLMASIRWWRYPLLSIGTLVPPECGLIAGYDEGGDVVIGWNHFQDWPENRASGRVSYEPDGQYRKRGWFADTIGWIAFQHKTVKPSAADTARRALEYAVTLGRTPRFRHYHAGLAAYDAWGEALRGDPGFSSRDREALDVRLMCHNDAVATLSEGRAAAAAYLREAALALPEQAAALEEAARCYDAEVELVQRMIATLGGFRGDPELARALAQPEMREQLAALVLEAGELEARALEQIAAVV